VTIIGYLVTYAYWQAQRRMQEVVWDPNELDQISI
jgi:hypothetical protein